MTQVSNYADGLPGRNALVGTGPRLPAGCQAAPRERSAARATVGHVPRRCRVLTIAVLVVLLVTMTLAGLAPALLPDGTGSTVVAPTR